MRRRILAAMAATALVVAGAAWSIFPNTEPPNPPLWTDHVDLLPEPGKQAEFASQGTIEIKVRLMEFDTRKASFFDPAPDGTLTCGRLKESEWENCGNAICQLDGVSLQSRPVLHLLHGQSGLVQVADRDHVQSVEIQPHWVDQHSIKMLVRLEMSDMILPPGQARAKPPNSTAAGKGQATIRVGETLVVGGLRQKQTIATTRPIPFLSALPWVGPHCSYLRHEPTEIEYVAFITPVRGAK